MVDGKMDRWTSESINGSKEGWVGREIGGEKDISRIDR